jgi:prophage regulatory protein
MHAMLVKMQQAERITSLSGSLIEKLVAKGEFPRPVPLSAGRIGFVEEEVRAWVRAKILLARRMEREAQD